MPGLPVRWVDDVVAAVARRVVRPGEAVAESALNERLRMFVLDVAFFRRHVRAVNIIGGALLIVLGVLMVTGLWTQLMSSLTGVIAGVELPL